MDFLQVLFGDKALTWEQFKAAVNAAADIKIGNLASGEYVAKGKFDVATQRVADLEEQLKTRDADFKKLQKTVEEGSEVAKQLETLKGQYKDLEVQSQAKIKAAERHTSISGKMVESGLTPKMVKAAMALLDDAKVGDDLKGLDEEITRLQKDYAEMFQTSGSSGTGANGANGGSGDSGDQSGDVNMDALKAAVFGHS